VKYSCKYDICVHMSKDNITIQYGKCSIHIGTGAIKSLAGHLKQPAYTKSKFFILVDQNTIKHCLPLLVDHVKALKSAEIIEVESGEHNKNIEVCIELWKTLGEYKANRRSVLINLGGGVIGDMGGFVASTFKRGIEFINIPTTLLSQVDASVGGKTGIDLNNLKNEIGVFNNPSLVIVYPNFLKSLNKKEYLSGYAEIIKHALIADASYWKKVVKTELSDEVEIANLIKRSIEIKHHVVKNDPLEKGLRKTLNFGHTIGHALESFFLEKNETTLLHGEAVAAGMICESYLSFKKNKLSHTELDEITSFIMSLYKQVFFKKEEEIRLIELMQHDKKNEDSNIIFSLLSKIGKSDINKTCSVDLIRDSFKYYREQYSVQNV
jgi:3-dehydroquinate synthase